MKTRLFSILTAASVGLLATMDSGICQMWTATTSPSNNWYSVAMSKDGSKIIAGGGRFIYTSTNYGVSWKSNNLPSLTYQSVASSANGVVLLASVEYSATIYCSTNAGNDWWLTTAPNRGTGLATSSNGSKLIAVSTGGYIHDSIDFGVTWRSNSAPVRHWYSVASSADGSKLAAVEGSIYTSTNSGTNWTITSAPSGSWNSIASSADGAKLLAVIRGGGIYTSTNSGFTWKTNGVPPNSSWFSVASSDDGTRLTVAGTKGPMYSSTNSGNTWSSKNPPDKMWQSVAVSADGSILAAAPSNGPIYIWQEIPNLIIKRSGSGVMVSWQDSAAAALFVLQENPSFTATNWANIVTAPTVSNGLKQVILPIVTNQMFYRLVSQQ